LEPFYKRKQEFAEVFKALVIANPDDRINVVELTNEMHCGRKTFYRYFENIDDLIIWIVRDALHNVVRTEFAEHQQVKPCPSLHDSYADWPFYTRITTADHFLEQGPYFNAVAFHWEDNRTYYETLFKNGDRRYFNLFAYLVHLYLPAFKDDVLYMLNGRQLEEDAVNFLAEYHAMGIFGRLDWHFGKTRKFIMQDDINPFWNHAHETMKSTIERLLADPEARFIQN
jgi:AcrR family transcriptional regulator